MAAVAALRPILVRCLQLVCGPSARKVKEFGNDTVKEFLKSNVFGWSSKTAFGDDDAEIKEKVDTVMKELEHFEKTVQESQTKINSQLAEAMTAIQDNHFNQKVDLVQRDVITIEALFDKYVGGMKTFEQIASVPSYRESRSTLTSVGQNITDEVYVAATSINKFLARQGADSLLSLPNAQSLRQKPDLWVHFYRMKSILLTHAFDQLKAVILFTFIGSDPEVSFSGASRIIFKLKKNL